MTFGAVAAGRRTVLQTLNPLVSVLVIAIVAVAMIVTLSPWASVIMIIAELPLLLLARLSPREWAMRAWPLAGALAGIIVANLLFTDLRSGVTLIQTGPIWITSDGLAAAAAVALRLLALAIPGVVLFARIDPTDLADALVTQWRAKPRIAVGSLAALRMAPLVLGDLRQSRAARRTRGLIGRNPLQAVGLFVGSLSAVLVAAVRRATRLSAAMDSRGFDSGVRRTVARESRWRRRDTLVTVGYLLVAVLSVAVGIAAR
ncbi:energy-coupling factor transporter transmembrane component T family protein [Microlunatus soli]|uniref:Energy-coupling factor transport system permease protein n=1 Tax=Microlunatus soli TaxID=630515 RepID=A0A1H1Z994_9ACTN|nr:energy-coupling factor transporter transmembrane component T [Microlunatus soli]SDT30395.1 energy-coupling factor transport system permease protein [Microlunatus soli]